MADNLDFEAWLRRKRLLFRPRPPKKYRRRPKRAKRYKVRRRSLKRYTQSFSRYREHNPEFLTLGDVPAGKKVGVRKVYQNNQLQSSQDATTTGAYKGSLVSERCWDSLNSGPPYRNGGPFALVRTNIQGSGYTPSGTFKSRMFAPGFWWQYDGSWVDDGNWLTDSRANYVSTNIPTLTGFDSLAWDKLKPQVAKGSAAQFLVELRDLPQMLITSASRALTFKRLFERKENLFNKSGFSVIMQPKSAADDFINHQFGWAPFVGDMMKFVDIHQNAERYLYDLIRQNDTWIRRKAVLQNDTTQNRIGRIYHPSVDPWGTHENGLCDDLVVDGITCKGYCDITEVVETKVWATGQFKYYRPEFDYRNPDNSGNMAALQRLLTLYGLRINPTVLWKVTPWSWAIDWFTHFGKFIERQDDFITDGIVARDLYLMRTMKRYVTKTSYINFSSGARVFTWRREFSTKVRKIASSPYGFDQPWAGLSPKQLAILAAIGISQSPTGFISRGA